MTATREEVVLLSDDGDPIGVADKASVHTTDTPLHLAFSCHLFDGEGRILVTRRALGKRTWPGVWTNSFCGHPAPGEAIEDAVVRRAQDELGAAIENLVVVLPDFRYRAVDASGIVEHEICPVYTATVAGELDPRADRGGGVAVGGSAHPAVGRGCDTVGVQPVAHPAAARPLFGCGPRSCRSAVSGTHIFHLCNQLWITGRISFR